MRCRLLIAGLAALSSFGVMNLAPISYAQAEECTGENCPPPAGQGGKHECERKKEQTVS